MRRHWRRSWISQAPFIFYKDNGKSSCRHHHTLHAQAKRSSKSKGEGLPWQPQQYASASNQKVRVSGKIRPWVQFQNGVCGRVELMVLQRLWKPIFSTSRMCKAGCDVPHTASHSWASHQGTGAENRILRARRRLRDASLARSFFLKRRASGEHCSPLVMGTGDDQAEEEDNVGMEAPPLVEESVVRALRAPVRPTLEMVEGREVCHVPYRPRCGFFVKGRGWSMAHRRVEEGDEQLPIFSVNYSFSCMCVVTSSSIQRCRESSWCDLSEGRSARTGIQRYRRMVRKSVGSRAHSSELCVGQVEMESAAEVVLDAAPIEGHEKSDGEAEATRKQVAGFVRTLRAHVQFHAGVEVPAKKNIMAWMVEHAGSVLSFFARGRDGQTPNIWQMVRPWRIALAPLGERVEFRRRARHKHEARFAARSLPGSEEAEQPENRWRREWSLRGAVNPKS